MSQLELNVSQSKPKAAKKRNRDYKQENRNYNYDPKEEISRYSRLFPGYASVIEDIREVLRQRDNHSGVVFNCTHVAPAKVAIRKTS
jgi:hypothetical protein